MCFNGKMDRWHISFDWSKAYELLPFAAVVVIVVVAMVLWVRLFTGDKE